MQKNGSFSFSISPFINASKSNNIPNFSILLLFNFYLMRIYIINFTLSFKILRKETFRFYIFFFIKKGSTNMSNFINLEPLYVNLGYKFHPFILCPEKGKVSVFRFHPLLTHQTLAPSRK